MSSAPSKGKLTRFLDMRAADRWLLVRAVAWLAAARLMLLLFPFQKLAERLAKENVQETGIADAETLSRVKFAVVAAANNVPWRSDCFPQSIAAKKLLKTYGHSSTIHLGVERSGGEGIAAHAWLTCGDTVVTGGQDLDRFVEVHRLGE